MTTYDSLLSKLLHATKPSRIDGILAELGDHTGITVNQEFGSEKYKWVFYGNSESNLSTVHLGSKPGRSLVERITNAIDAVLEARMSQTTSVPKSPMDAAKTWFGRPPTTADNGLFAWKDYRTNDYDSLVQVVVTPGDQEIEPTIDIIDKGIGITPDAFKDTILSLHRGNKMTKPYLVGAFGQGGSATIRYSKYTLIFSRHINSPNIVGFSLVKKMRLPEPYKNDAYVYLAIADDNGKLTVPSITLNGSLDPYQDFPGHGVTLWDYGTLVRHYGYELRNLDKRFQASPGNLYHLFQCLMFDPLLPFNLYDLRQKKDSKYQREIIRGSRNRLMRYVGKPTTEDDELPDEVDAVQLENTPKATDNETREGKSKSRIAQYGPRELVSLRNDVNPNVGIEYWVILSERKSNDKIISRPSSELFVERGHPIIGSLYGQNHGDQTDRLFRTLELSTVGKNIVVHIDATNADKDTRLELFSSDREGFSEGNAFYELMKILTDMIKSDSRLYEIENELIASVIQRQTSNTDSEVKKEIIGLLRDAGLKVKDTGETIVPGDGDETYHHGGGHRPGPHPRPDLPTLPYPQVTKFEIVFPKDVILIPQNNFGTVLLETDADVRFDREQRIAIRAEPLKLIEKTKSDLRGGRMKWRLQPIEGAQPGDIGEIIATITIPPGNQQIEARILYEIMPPVENRGKKSQGQVPPFDILPVDPYTERELFEKIWQDIRTNEEISNLAYRTIKQSGKIFVYYSTAFEPFRHQRQQLLNRPELSQLFEKNYKIWIGYHAILQEMQKPLDPEFNPPPDSSEKGRIQEYLDQYKEQLEEQERALVAEMQVKQAYKSAQRESELLKAKSD